MELVQLEIRLTVILSVFNGMPYLPKAVESILSQSFADFVFIIVNDGSTDGSGDYLRSLSDPRILLINQANEGQGAARNTALRRCQSEYVALMDADDISLPDRFLSQLEYLDAHPDVVMLGTQLEFLVGTVGQRALCVPVGHDDIETRLLKGRSGLCNSSLMFRTAAAIACGGYPAGVVGEDIDFCLRMCEQGRAANLGRVLLQYRLHTAQTSLARCRELILATRYVAYRTICRRKGLPTPTLDSYFLNASLISRWRWSIEAWELIQYRTARIQMASGRTIRGLLRFALLGLCRPFATIGRIAGTIGTLHRRCTG
jgi:glycosyltransferase involved in cell wall biosynthesis